MSVVLPEALEMSGVTDIACDGILRQMFLAGMDTITVSREDTRTVTVPLRNPLLLPLSFLLPSDACALCELRLADLRAVAPARWNGTASSGGVFRYGEDTRHEVTVSPAGEVTEFTSSGPGGRLLTRVLFSDYRRVPGAGWRFPRTIRREVMPEEGEGAGPDLVVVYTIERLSLNPPLDVSTFQISWERAGYVWDDERATHVKRPGRSREPREKPNN